MYMGMFSFNKIMHGIENAEKEVHICLSHSTRTREHTMKFISIIYK